jgi:hypothetical protein
MQLIVTLTALAILAGIVEAVLIEHRREVKRLRQFNSLVNSGRVGQTSLPKSDHG